MKIVRSERDCMFAFCPKCREEHYYRKWAKKTVALARDCREKIDIECLPEELLDAFYRAGFYDQSLARLYYIVPELVLKALDGKTKLSYRDVKRLREWWPTEREKRTELLEFLRKFFPDTPPHVRAKLVEFLL